MEEMTPGRRGCWEGGGGKKAKVVEVPRWETSPQSGRGALAISRGGERPNNASEGCSPKKKQEVRCSSWPVETDTEHGCAERAKAGTAASFLAEQWSALPTKTSVQERQNLDYGLNSETRWGQLFGCQKVGPFFVTKGHPRVQKDGDQKTPNQGGGTPPEKRSLAPCLRKGKLTAERGRRATRPAGKKCLGGPSSSRARGRTLTSKR